MPDRPSSSFISTSNPTPAPVRSTLLPTSASTTTAPSDASRAALVSALFAPFYQVLIWGPGPTAIAAGAMGVLLIWRHAANIQKLLNGTESKLGQKSGQAAPAASHGHGARRDHPKR